MELVSQSHACSDGNDAALDSIRVKVILAQMLTSADAAAHTAFFPHQLGEKTFIIASQRNIMSVTAMIGKDEVSLLQRSRKSDCREFLSNAGMHGTVQLSFCKQGKEGLLYFSNEESLLDDPMVYDNFVQAL